MILKSLKITCTKCGKKMYLLAHDPDSEICRLMKERQLCYDCAYWIHLASHPKEYMQIIAGIYYTFYPPVPKRKLGEMLGGRGMKYIYLKDGSILKSNDIWRVGMIPERFRDILPDTAWWIDKESFHKLRRIEPFTCTNQGCYDRYHCYWFDIRSEYQRGPWNIVPRTHIPGKEHCPSFINLAKFKHYEMITDNNDMIEAVPL